MDIELVHQQKIVLSKKLQNQQLNRLNAAGSYFSNGNLKYIYIC